MPVQYHEKKDCMDIPLLFFRFEIFRLEKVLVSMLCGYMIGVFDYIRYFTVLINLTGILSESGNSEVSLQYQRKCRMIFYSIQDHRGITNATSEL